MSTDEKPPKRCDHVLGLYTFWQSGEFVLFTESEKKGYEDTADEWFTYCPNCGEKLPEPP